MVVGGLVSYWGGNFSGAMLNFGRVNDALEYLNHMQQPAGTVFFVTTINWCTSITPWTKIHYLEPETTIYTRLFQLDDSKSLYRKWLFHQTSIYKWLFGVPGIIPWMSWIKIIKLPFFWQPAIHGGFMSQEFCKLFSKYIYIWVKL